MSGAKQARRTRKTFLRAMKAVRRILRDVPDKGTFLNRRPPVVLSTSQEGCRLGSLPVRCQRAWGQKSVPCLGILFEISRRIIKDHRFVCRPPGCQHKPISQVALSWESPITGKLNLYPFAKMCLESTMKGRGTCLAESIRRLSLQGELLGGRGRAGRIETASEGKGFRGGCVCARRRKGWGVGLQKSSPLQKKKPRREESKNHWRSVAHVGHEARCLQRCRLVSLRMEPRG